MFHIWSKSASQLAVTPLPTPNRPPQSAYQQHTPFTMADADANTTANLYNYDAVSVRRF
jgi:hypothetical protein